MTPGYFSGFKSNLFEKFESGYFPGYPGPGTRPGIFRGQFKVQKKVRVFSGFKTRFFSITNSGYFPGCPGPGTRPGSGANPDAYPLVYGMVNDGTVSYDQDKDGGETGMLNNCYAGLRNKNHDSHLRIYYNYEEKYLEVGIDVDQNDKFD